MTISQIAAPMLIFSAVRPTSPHGEADAKPSPEPRLNRIRLMARAASAPAAIAGQLIADTDGPIVSSSTTVMVMVAFPQPNSAWRDQRSAAELQKKCLRPCRPGFP